MERWCRLGQCTRGTITRHAASAPAISHPLTWLDRQGFAPLPRDTVRGVFQTLQPDFREDPPVGPPRCEEYEDLLVALQPEVVLFVLMLPQVIPGLLLARLLGLFVPIVPIFFFVILGGYFVTTFVADTRSALFSMVRGLTFASNSRSISVAMLRPISRNDAPES